MHDILDMILGSEAYTVGTRQVLRAVERRTVNCVVLADDADIFLAERVLSVCNEANIPVVRGKTKAQLGEICCLQVGAACIGVLLNEVI